jgi:hypothetical protein
LLIALCLASPAVACPFCKDGVTTDKSNTQTAEAASLDFNTSIYAMLAGLAGVGGFTARVMYKAIKSDP